MKKLWRLLGVIGFWLTWPALVVYLNRSERARILVVCGDDVLLLKPWFGINKWGIPGGGLHMGETPIDAALREVHEETGLTVERSRVKKLFSAPYIYRGFRYPCHYFVVVFDHKPAVKTQKIEIAEYAWLDHRKLTIRNSHPDTLTTVEAWFES